MARPIKNNCEYFSHDADMRNHRKVKALRNQFSNGYAIWCMLLEYLTAADGNEFEKSDIEFELISGDFGFPLAEISGVISFCLRLELLFERDGFIYSETLNERLKCVYDKRGRDRENSKRKLRVRGKFASDNSKPVVLPMTETPQSKVKESIYNYMDFVQSINGIGKRRFRKDAKSERQFAARIKEGFTKENFTDAIMNAHQDQYHIGNGFMYLTPEFFTRPDKLNMFMNRTKPNSSNPAIDPAERARLEQERHNFFKQQ